MYIVLGTFCMSDFVVVFCNMDSIEEHHNTESPAKYIKSRVQIRTLKEPVHHLAQSLLRFVTKDCINQQHRVIHNKVTFSDLIVFGIDIFFTRAETGKK